ncbi:MAG: hypothetical protein CM15mP109_05030 [Candidatus Dadabacteria bacterium]|nr:MAG: hypothetical protein CM15mP109_05030 [Candidatus Dadabacteria bacterium]
MIIISATLNFETKEQRDKAVEITADIQLALVKKRRVA